MGNFRKLYRVPRSLRLLAGAGALAVAISLPALLSSGNKLTVLVLACGAFSASVALFGRAEPRASRTGLRT